MDTIDISKIAEKYDLTQKVPSASVGVMGVSLFMLLLIIILYYFWIRHAYPKKNKGVFMGMAAYFLIWYCLLGLIYTGERYLIDALASGGMAEAQKTAVTNVIDVLGMVLEGVILVYVVYFAYSKFFYQPGESSYGNTLSFALGFTMIESLSWVVSMIMMWIYGTTINQMGLEEIVKNLKTEADVDGFMTEFTPMFNNGPLFYAMAFFERVLFIVFIVSLMTMIYAVVVKSAKKSFLAVICLIYVAFNIINKSLINYISSDVIVRVFEMVYIGFVAWLGNFIFKKYMPLDWEKHSEIKKMGAYKIIFTSPNTLRKKQEKGSISKNANVFRE